MRVSALAGTKTIVRDDDVKVDLLHHVVSSIDKGQVSIVHNPSYTISITHDPSYTIPRATGLSISLNLP